MNFFRFSLAAAVLLVTFISPVECSAQGAFSKPIPESLVSTASIEFFKRIELYDSARFASPSALYYFRGYAFKYYPRDGTYVGLKDSVVYLAGSGYGDGVVGVGDFDYLLGRVRRLTQANVITARPRYVIAHRGASGYQFEHTFAAKELAVKMGADLLEQDVVMSKQGTLLVSHDVYMEDVTNVKDKYPGRARNDGHFYFLDFTDVEIFGLRSGNERIHSLPEELDFINNLRRKYERPIGIHVEIKSPQFHKKNGLDISKEVIKLLAEYGYDQKDDLAFIQSFDYEELVRIKTELFPIYGINLDLLLIVTADYEANLVKRDPAGTLTVMKGRVLDASNFRTLDTLLDGLLIDFKLAMTTTPAELKSTGLVEAMHQAGLVAQVYTLNPTWLNGQVVDKTGFNDKIKFLYERIGVDGIFSDYPDLLTNARDY